MTMCNNDEICLFDLVVTGDEEFAAETLRSSEENRRVQEIISKRELGDRWIRGTIILCGGEQGTHGSSCDRDKMADTLSIHR